MYMVQRLPTTLGCNLLTPSLGHELRRVNETYNLLTFIIASNSKTFVAF